MMKTIGIVAEGPRDYDLLSAVIDTITGQENSYQMIQPEPDASGQFGNGWKGVWKWCDSNKGKLNTYMHSVTPIMDFLVIHMDGDVQRCEKEVHCACQREFCDASTDINPLKCSTLIANKKCCPVKLPCENHGSDINSKAEFLRDFIKRLLDPEVDLAVSYVIPYDATDTWIIAAFDEYDNCESLTDPWDSIIAKTPKYHGIKIKNRPHKAKRTYEELILAVCNNWNNVIKKCPQAKRFDEDVRRYLVNNK